MAKELGTAQEELVSIDLRRYFAVVRKYKWLIAAIVTVALTGTLIYTSRQTKIYRGTATVLIDPRPPDYLGGQIQEIVQLGTGNFFSNTDYYNSQVEVIKSNALARRAVSANDLHTKLLNVPENDTRTRDELLNEAAEILQARLKVSVPEQNRILYVSVVDPDPELAAFIANAVVDSYIEYSLNLRVEGTEVASKWLASEFDASGQELRKSELELFEYKRDNDMLSMSLEDGQNIVSKKIARFTDAMSDAKTQRIELGALLERVRNASKLDILESPIFSLAGSTSLEQLKTQYYLERNKFLELEEDLGPKHAEYSKQKQKVDELYTALQREAKAAERSIEEKYKAATETEQKFAQEVEHYKKEAFELELKAVKYDELKRQEADNEKNYGLVTDRLRTSDLTSRLKTINVRRLDRAKPSDIVVSPNLRKNLIVAGAGAIVFAILLAFLFDFLDRTVKSTQDVEAAAKAPVLGIIPVITERLRGDESQRDRDLYVFKNPTSAAAECCRSLRTNILFTGADRPLKTLVITSPNPREGKTTTVIYLGTTMAQSGQRVLLVDSDMRRPRLHQSTGVSRTTGLSNLMLREMDYDDVIKTTDIPNLYVLPCGPLPPNPAELLLTQRFQETLAELAKRFDRVLLDSPPILALTDAVVLSRQVDGVLLVARSGKTTRDDVSRSSGQLADVNANLVGVVVNELNLDDRNYGYYNHYYYSYGYGPDEDKAEAAG